MHIRSVLLALLAALVPSCKTTDCGDGTTERNGICVPANETIGNAMCGPGTELHADGCVPSITPTKCDPATTQEEVGSDGVIRCVGNGGGGCGAKLACPSPTDGKQSICGQIFDFETNQPFEQADATGAQCKAGATSGPCTLGIRAFDAVDFVMHPTTSPPLTTDPVYIDDCGRYRVTEISQPTGPFVALTIDDAMIGPGGTTNPVGIATAKGPNTATKDFDAFILRSATVTGWGATPSLAMGLYAPVYRGHRTGQDLAAGVTFSFAPMSPPQYPTMTDANRDFYFTGCPTNRTTLDPAANLTSTTGTVLVSGANLGEAYAGLGGLPPQCIWEPHGGAAIPNAIFIQVFRPISAPGQTCPL
jgi:hypothetical protein